MSLMNALTELAIACSFQSYAALMTFRPAVKFFIKVTFCAWQVIFYDFFQKSLQFVASGMTKA
jgi:hypothetical protein